MKKVAIIAPQFPPCNLTASHRSRYFASNLKKFGWKPYIISIEEKHYGSQVDNDLLKIIPNDLEIIRTKAFGAKPFKIIGDLGLRSIYWHYKALSRLIERESIDLVFIPIPPNYSSILGYLIYKKYGIPYAIDYIDPWLFEKDIPEKIFSKSWITYYLSRFLEPLVLSKVSLISSVAPLYYQKIKENYKWLSNCKFVSMPYGFDENEFEFVSKNKKDPYLFKNKDESFKIIYAGAMLPKAYDILKAFFRSIELMNLNQPEIGEKIKVYFVGTGKDPNDNESYSLKNLIKQYNLENQIFEYPAKIPYLDVLNHLNAADAVLVLGSTERHYSPSKIFQAVMSKKPIFALLHDESTAVDIIQEINAKYLITFTNSIIGEEFAKRIYRTLIDLVSERYDPCTIKWEIFNKYSIENMTQILAKSFDEIV